MIARVSHARFSTILTPRDQNNKGDIEMKKKLAVTNHDECRACLSCVVACSTAFHKSMNEDQSCIQLGYKKDQLKVMVCVQCGKCAKNCPEEAIKQNKFGVYTIDKKKCVNCGKCAEICPFGLIVNTSDKPTPNKCIACGACVKACPAGILYIQEKED